MRKIGLRLLGMLAGALAFVLTAGQAAESQPYTTGPPQSARPPSRDVIGKMAALERGYCNLIARAGTTEEVQRVVEKLTYFLNGVAEVIKEEKRAKAKVAEDKAKLDEDEQRLAQRRAASPLPQAEFDQANAQFEAQVKNSRARLESDKQVASNLGDRIKRLAPYLIAPQSIANAVIQCAQQRVAQIRGATPTPYAPQTPPSAVAGAPLAGQVTWAMNCSPNQGVYTGPQSGQLSLVVGADGSFSGTGPSSLQVSGQVDPTGLVRGTITDVPGSYLTGSLDRNAALGSGRLGFDNPGGWGVCSGQWQFGSR